MENVYSQLKIFHFRDRLEALARGEVRPPLHMRLKPINACNHRCHYCCYRSDNLFLGQRMRESDAIPGPRMREMTADMVACGVKAVTFTGGGEPLLYPHFVQAARDLLAGGVKVAVLTNGSLLDGDRAEVLAEGASWVRVSMDSTDGASMARSRGVAPGEFDRVLGNIRRFARARHRDCELGVNLIVTADNAGRVYDFIRLLKEAGAGHVKASGCVVATGAAGNNRYHAPHFGLVRDQLSHAAADLADSSFAVIDKFHEMDGQYAKAYDICPYARVFLNVVGADQCVYACQDKAYTDSGLLGSVRERSLREFWESEEYAMAVRSLDPSRQCGHHCVQHGKNLALLDWLRTDPRHLEFV